MTREFLNRSLKPIEWNTTENSNYQFAMITELYEAMIMSLDNGSIVASINKNYVLDTIEKAEFPTIQEAVSFVEEWRINYFCEFFEIED